MSSRISLLLLVLFLSTASISCSSNASTHDADGVDRCYEYCQMPLDDVDRSAMRTMSNTEVQYLVPATRCEACHQALENLMAINYQNACGALLHAERLLIAALSKSSDRHALVPLAESVRSARLEFARSKRELSRWSPQLGDLVHITMEVYDEIDRWEALSVQEILEIYREA